MATFNASLPPGIRLVNLTNLAVVGQFASGTEAVIVTWP
jgi:hypothetical protein